MLSNNQEQKVKELLKTAIIDAINDGYITFISGMARGIDIWSAEIVLELKKKFPEIHLICAIPYDGFEKRWDTADQERYNYILERADYIIFGLPKNCIEGILVGRQVEQNNKHIETLKALFPNSYICNLDGVVIR